MRKCAHGFCRSELARDWGSDPLAGHREQARSYKVLVTSKGGALIRAIIAPVALTLPSTAAAHGFGRLYNLPVPLWLYAWAASAALIASFLLIALFAGAPARPRPSAAGRKPAPAPRWLHPLRHLLPALRGLSVLLLLLTMATAFFGNRDPSRNFSMSFFWVVFLLGFTYLTALVGNLYAAINPWRVLADCLGRVLRGYGAGRLRYPAGLGDWPALALYLGFIWFELFGLGRPQPLGMMLLGYTALNFFGVWLVGTAAWFAHCEFFGVLLRLVALLSPLAYQPAQAASASRASLHLRTPQAGLVQERPQGLGTVAFALAMLATTSFDGLRATQWWVRLFWDDPSGIVTALAGTPPMLAYALLRPWYIAWETCWLLALPLLYLAAYLACLALAKGITRSTRPLRQWALDFGYTLLPIALAYHLSHYATLMLSQGLKIVSLASDPFGWGWNLLGTAGLLRAPILPAMGLVWHSQVGIILLGHIASVALAHGVALRVLPTRRQALLSQLPMLGLMLALTVAGLWILAQPLTVERML